MSKADVKLTPIEQTLVVAGQPVRMLRGGSGERVLFLHGASGLMGWIPFLQALSARHEVLFPEHPGFGLSGAPGFEGTIAGLTTYYLDFVAQLGLGPVHLVGSSLGGWLAAELAASGAVELRTFTVLGPAGLRPRPAAPAGTPPPTPEQATRRLYHDQSHADRILARVLTAQQAAISATNRAAAARMAGPFHNPALEAALRKIQAPSLVMWGREDRIVPSAQAALWGEALPDATVHVLPECGHLPHLERPDEAAAIATAFLASHEAHPA
jgi:pimeloyl-ACP methyl ester carboxylesterase